MVLCVFVIGPAGSGKSTFVKEFSEYLEDFDIHNVKVNMDPAVDKLPYEPDVDIRDYITATELEEKLGLGPNGAIIAATDLSVNYLREVKNSIMCLKPGYVLIDTPGQMELFTFRSSGAEIVTQIAEERSCILFLLDSALVATASTFTSSILLSISVYYRFNLPQIILLNKIDLMSENEVERVVEWVNCPDKLLTDLRNEGQSTIIQVNETIVQALADFMTVFSTIPMSAKYRKAFEDIYAKLQQIYVGGEDYITLSP